MVPALVCINQFCLVSLYLLLVVLVPRGCNSFTSPSASLQKSIPTHLTPPQCTPSGSNTTTVYTINNITNLFYKAYTSLHNNSATVDPLCRPHPTVTPSFHAFIILVLVGDLCPWHCWHRLNTYLIGPLPIYFPYFSPPTHLLSIICYPERDREEMIDGVDSRWWGGEL